MLTPQQVAGAAAARFSNASDVVAYFEQRFRTHFIEWFNAHCAGRGAWEGKSLNNSDSVRTRLLAIWNNIPGIFDHPSVNLLQFVALSSILTIEAGAELLPRAELCGRDGYPGLVYPFEHVPGIKNSYNTGSGNKPAGDLFFEDPQFWAAHHHLPAADLVRAIPNLREEWNTAVYPRHLIPVSLDPAQSGFIQQADFFKFRGRGFIQTTWRVNYKLIAEFVQNYSGSNATVRRYRAAWEGIDPDIVCTTSTNQDWDALFEEPDLIVACEAIRLHNRANGDYLQLSEDPTVLESRHGVRGSLYCMGLRINGGGTYAARFCERVSDIIGAMFPQAA